MSPAGGYRSIEDGFLEAGLASGLFLRKGMVVDGESEEDEVFIILMRGQADTTVLYAGAMIGDFPLRADGRDRAIYLQPHAAYKLAAIDDCDVAYARAKPSDAAPPQPRGFAPAGGRLEIDDHPLGMALALTTVAAGAALVLDAPTTPRLSAFSTSGLAATARRRWPERSYGTGTRRRWGRARRPLWRLNAAPPTYWSSALYGAPKKATG